MQMKLAVYGQAPAGSLPLGYSLALSLRSPYFHFFIMRETERVSGIYNVYDPSRFGHRRGERRWRR